eukprot:XP_001692652.1 predicted protein [Chlamydomonas reinhardtii]
MSQLQQQQPGLAPSHARDAQGIAGLFGQSEHADCQLVFMLERPPTSLETRPYEGSSSAAAGAAFGADQRRCGEPLPAHSIVLRLASDKFAAQLPEVHLTVGGEEELPAARAAIHFAYTGRVEAGASIREVLQDTAFAALLTEAKRRLVAHFGDALAVLNKKQLYEQMRVLPAEGLEALLESDDFGTDSESSVVLVLADRTDAATRKQLCGLLRLSQCSRSYLSWVLPALAARHEAGPDSTAGWLPLTRDDATCLLTYSLATEKERRAITGEGLLSMSVAIGHWPAKWLSTQRRRQCLPAEGRTIGFSASLAELTKAFEGLKPAVKVHHLYPSLADTRHANRFGAQGWDWSPYVLLTSGGVAAGVFVKARMPAALGASASAAAAGDKLLNGAVVTVPRLRLTVCGAGGQQAWSNSYDSSSEVVKAGYSWGWAKALELRVAPAATDQPGGTAANGSSSGSGSSGVVAARWAGYLQGGTRLSGSVTLLRPPEYYA